MSTPPNFLKRLSTQILGAVLFLRSGSLDELETFFRAHGAFGQRGYWLIDEEGINKIDFLGCAWRLLDEPTKKSDLLITGWEPAFVADVYVKGWDRDASADALRRLMVALLEKYGGIVIRPGSWRAPRLEDVFTLDDIQAGCNSYDIRFLGDSW